MEGEMEGKTEHGLTLTLQSYVHVRVVKRSL
jgi:hypothetical protein